MLHCRDESFPKHRGSNAWTSPGSFFSFLVSLPLPSEGTASTYRGRTPPPPRIESGWSPVCEKLPSLLHYIYYMVTLGQKLFPRHVDGEKRETFSASASENFSAIGVAAAGNVSPEIPVNTRLTRCPPAGRKMFHPPRDHCMKRVE